MDEAPESYAGAREGQILAGKYRIEKVLGVGGMGVVVAARHLQLDTKVAIKFLLPAMLASAESVARFAREARAAVRITSEHVARVLDVGTLETGAPYMVMEFLEGEDLSEWLRRRGAMPVEQAIEFVLQASEAIAEAHSLGIVHRDLKPANLFCIRRADGQLAIKVLDFGISKMNDMGSSAPVIAVTKTTAMMGSPLYMSPEQMQSSKDVDARTDVWALGIIFHELLTGRVPFDGESFPEVCIKVATQEPPRLRDARPDAPPALEAVITRCLQKNRTNRFASVAEFASALAEVGSTRARVSIDRIAGIAQVAWPASRASSLPGSSVPMAGAHSQTHGSMGRTDNGAAVGGRHSMSWVWVGAVVVAGTLTVTAVVVAKKTSGAGSPSATSSVTTSGVATSGVATSGVATSGVATSRAAAEADASLSIEPRNPEPASASVAVVDAGASIAAAVPSKPRPSPAMGSPRAAAAPTPRSASNPPPPASVRDRNPMDLGGFQ